MTPQMDNKQVKLRIQGRQYTLMYTFLSILSLGLFHILKRHLTFLEYIFTIPCKLEEAEYVLCLDNKKIYEVQKIVLKKNSSALRRFIKNQQIRLLEVMHHRFLFDYMANEYVKIGPYKGQLDQLEKFILYGENVLNVKQKSNLELIFYRMTDWVFLYEIWCIIIWYLTDYAFYATIIVAINLLYLIIDIRKDIKSKMSPPAVSKVNVLKNKIVPTMENCLFPGDRVILDVGEVVADIEILNGEVIVDESFLTGESIPLCRGTGSLILAGTRILKSVGNGDIETVRHLHDIEKLQNIGLPIRMGSQIATLENQKKQSVSFGVTKAIGEVKKTGFETYRGSIMREMLSCPKTMFPFIEQFNTLVLIFVLVFFFLAATMFFYYETVSGNIFSSLVYANDMFLIAVSPTLFVSIKLGMVLCDERLKKAGVFVRDLNRLNGVGYVQTVVFDKTGTLTNEDLDILCVDEVKYLRKQTPVVEEVVEPESHIKKLDMKNILTTHENDKTLAEAQTNLSAIRNYNYSENNYRDELDPLELYKHILEMQQAPGNGFARMTKMGLSVCHSIMEINGKLLGDPLDLKMFEYSGSTLNDRVVNVEGVGIVEILKYNEFTSLRRLMSVVICEGRKRYLFAKGSPEAILGTLANAPPQYHDVVNYYALEGFRVIAMAYKCLVGKDEGETNLNFLGFLVFSNQLKPTTKNVIADLRAANLNCKMATGDGILTAISVATQCGLLDRESPVIFPKLSPSAQSLNDIDWMCIGDHDLYFDKVRLALISEEDGIDVDFAIACEGAIYEKIREESEQYHNFILSKGIVFARMSPEQKKHLVEDLQTTKTTVCFCGDGANDSSALTAANVGISLNVGQQYFAGFTSKVKNIECVVHIIREGRAALVASISNFRLQILISIIQLFSCSLLSCLFLFPSEAQTCHYDLLFAFISAYVLSSFKTSTTLHREQPKIDILSKAFLVPLGGHLLIDLIFAMGIFIYVREPTTSHVFRKESATVTVSFFITIIQGIMGFCIFTEGLPHRESKYKNPKFITFIVAHVSFLILILLGSTYIDAVSKFYSFVWKSMSQRIFVVVYGMLNALVLLLFHGFIDRAGNDLFCKKSKIQRKTEKYEEFL